MTNNSQKYNLPISQATEACAYGEILYNAPLIFIWHSMIWREESAFVRLPQILKYYSYLSGRKILAANQVSLLLQLIP
mgnify:CR=1 FL=1